MFRYMGELAHRILTESTKKRSHRPSRAVAQPLAGAGRLVFADDNDPCLRHLDCTCQGPAAPDDDTPREVDTYVRPFRRYRQSSVHPSLADALGS